MKLIVFWSMMFLCVSIISLSGSPGLLGGSVKIQGHYVWTIMAHAAAPETSKTNTFIVNLGPNCYRLESTDYYSDLPCEAVYNGSEIASIIRGRQVDRPTNIVELASIEIGNHPKHTAQILQVIWLAYASAIYAPNTGDVLRDISCLKVWERHPIVTPNSKVELVSQPTVFIKKAKLFCSPISRTTGGTEILLPPFDKGFLCASYDVIRWKEYNGAQYPEKSIYQVLFAADQTHANQAKSAEDSHLARRCELTITSVEICDEPIQPLKCRDTITWLDDYRLLDKYSTPRKMTNGIWPKLEDYNLPKDFEEVRKLEILRRDQMELNKPTGEVFNYKYARLTFFLCFIMSIFLIPIYFKKLDK